MAVADVVASPVEDASVAVAGVFAQVMRDSFSSCEEAKPPDAASMVVVGDSSGRCARRGGFTFPS